MSETAEPPLFLEGRPEEHTRKVALAVREILAGKTNNVGIVTLSANETTTVFEAERISFNSAIFLSPRSASAAGATNSIWFEAGNGSVTIHHDSSTATDRTFGLVFVG